jgi:hypothetical protein
MCISQAGGNGTEKIVYGLGVASMCFYMRSQAPKSYPQIVVQK